MKENNIRKSLLLHKLPNLYRPIISHLHKIYPLAQPRHIHIYYWIRYLAMNELLTIEVMYGHKCVLNWRGGH